MVIGFSAAEYRLAEDDEEGMAGTTLTVQVLMISSVEIEREFTFYVSAIPGTATSM